MRPMYIPEFADANPGDLDAVPWTQQTDARLECFMSEESMTYTYGSGRGVRTYVSTPLLPWVQGIMDALNYRMLVRSHAVERCYNVCFLNRYDHAGHHLGWHADDSPGMDLDHPIAVVSFGQAREIWWRPNGQVGVVSADQRQLLEHGSLFVMPAGFQRDYQHRVPRVDRAVGRRVSLTFRHYVPTSS